MFNTPITSLHVLNKEGLAEAFTPLAKKMNESYTFHSIGITDRGEDLVCFQSGHILVEIPLVECQSAFYEAASSYIGHEVDQMLVLEIDDYLEQYVFRKK